MAPTVAFYFVGYTSRNASTCSGVMPSRIDHKMKIPHGHAQAPRPPGLRSDYFASYKSGTIQRGHMAAREQVEARSSLSKVVLYATVMSGFVAAYLMYRRGESMVS